MRSVSKPEFVAEMRQFVTTAANDMFNAYDDRYDYKDRLLAVKRGFFEGVVNGLLKTVSSYSPKNCSEDIKMVKEKLDGLLSELSDMDYREHLLGGCYELIDGLAILIYGKEEGGTSEWI